MAAKINIKSVALIADGGATKCEWAILAGNRVRRIQTHGLSPYFLTGEQIRDVIAREVASTLKNSVVSEVSFYGTGLGTPANKSVLRKALRSVFPEAKIHVEDDMLGTARALNGREPGIACNLGTGSFSCYYNGSRIVRKVSGLGYVLGDEGSGTWLGKRVLQHYLYGTFDEDLMHRFESAYPDRKPEILENVYRKPLPNRYLAGFALFLHDNRGHYMVENIIEDGLNDFIFHHIYKFRESWTLPIHFTGSIAFGFRDVLQELCRTYELRLGKVIRKPIDGLIAWHAGKGQAHPRKTTR